MSRTADPWGQHWSLASDAGIGHDSEDIDAYISPEVFAAECDKIFRRTWLLIGRESELPEPGDFIKRTIHPLKAEVIVVRGKDGQVRAFHNACAHRGAALVRESEGTAKVFVCPYHAWSYDLDGRCRGITGPEFFPQVERKDIGLSAVHAETWNGFVFVNLDREPRESLTQFLGEMGELYGDFPFHEFTHGVEIVQDIETNWKCFLDAFVEGYHANFVHNKTGPMFLTRDNPLNVFYDGRFLGPHSSFVVQSNPEWHPTSEVTKFVYASGVSIVGDVGSAAAAESQKTFMQRNGVNPLGLPQFGVRLIYLFPMTQIVLFTNRYQVLQYWPLSVERTRFVFRVYTAVPPASYRERFAESCLVAQARDLLTEDVAMTQLQQIGLRGRGEGRVHFGDNEVGIRFAHQAMRSYLDAPD